VTSATTSYAVQTGNGTVVFLDDSSNSQVQRIAGSAPATGATSATAPGMQDVHVTITGSMDGQFVRSTDIRRQQ
jgi:hypothetical protein